MRYLLSFLLILFWADLSAQNFNKEVEAIISSNSDKDDILEITGVAKNLTQGNFSLSYELTVISENENNNSSKNSQSGRFTLEPFETKSLSKTSVSVAPEGSSIVLLIIYDEDKKPIGKARSVFGKKEDQKKENKISYEKKNEGIELKGIVTEDTKTKFGKDFYDYFYQQYNLSHNKSERIIKIEEQISFGRTTRIMVKVDDQIVYQFYGRPKLDYLKAQANVALQRLNRHLQILNNRNEYEKNY